MRLLKIELASLKFADILKIKSSLEKVLIIAILTGVFLGSIYLRLLCLKYGFYLLDEFDPYFQYWMAKYVVDRSWSGFAEWFYWFNDPKFWYPYGRAIVHTAFPGVAFTGSFVYLFLNSIGISMDLMSVCAFLPVFMGSLTIVLMYNLGKEVEGRVAGLLSVVFLASSAAYLSRTTFGFFDDESVGILALVCLLILYARSLNKEGRVLEASLAGVFLGYLAASWGAASYIINCLAIHAVLMVLMGKYSRKLLTSYATTVSVALSITILIPKYGPKYVTSGLGFPALIAYAVLTIAEVASRLEHRRERILLVSSILLASTLGLAILWLIGYIGAPLRYLSVLNPFIRSPLVASVAEHQAITWAHFFFDYQLSLPLAFFGLFILLRRRNEIDILLSFMTVFTIYSAASMARLLVPLAVFISLLAGVGLSHVILALARRVMYEEKGRKKYRIGLGRKWALMNLFIIMLFFTPLISLPVLPVTGSSLGLIARAETPQMIVTSAFSVTTPIPDWINTLAWMRDNLPEHAVVASWWDYGYHMTVMTGRASTCDNAAISDRQIATVARAFLSNEAEAVKILRKLNVTHVVVFGYVQPYLALSREGMYLWYYASLGGFVGDDVAKSQWMALIAGLDPNDYLKDASFIHPTLNTFTSIIVPGGTKAEEAVIYQMIFNNHEGPLALRGPIIKNILVDEQWKIKDVLEFNVVKLKHFKLAYASEPHHFILVYEMIYN